MELDNFLSSRHSIYALFHPIGPNMRGLLTNVYGPQLPNQKPSFLHFFQWLFLDQPHPMDIFGGDFNLITSLQDKQGGRQGFQEVHW